MSLFYFKKSFNTYLISTHAHHKFSITLLSSHKSRYGTSTKAACTYRISNVVLYGFKEQFQVSHCDVAMHIKFTTTKIIFDTVGVGCIPEKQGTWGCLLLKTWKSLNHKFDQALKRWHYFQNTKSSKVVRRSCLSSKEALKKRPMLIEYSYRNPPQIHHLHSPWSETTQCLSQDFQQICSVIHAA